jgi:hypothetical protein
VADYVDGTVKGLDEVHEPFEVLIHRATETSRDVTAKARESRGHNVVTTPFGHEVIPNRRCLRVAVKENDCHAE